MMISTKTLTLIRVSETQSAIAKFPKWRNYFITQNMYNLLPEDLLYHFAALEIETLEQSKYSVKIAQWFIEKVINNCGGYQLIN